jgi:hypothetical protein
MLITAWASIWSGSAPIPITEDGARFIPIFLHHVGHVFRVGGQPQMVWIHTASDVASMGDVGASRNLAAKEGPCNAMG